MCECMCHRGRKAVKGQAMRVVPLSYVVCTHMHNGVSVIQEKGISRAKVLAGSFPHKHADMSRIPRTHGKRNWA